MQGIGYDFDSIMHYGSYDVAINHNMPVSIRPQDGSISLSRLGQTVVCTHYVLLAPIAHGDLVLPLFKKMCCVDSLCMCMLDNVEKHTAILMIAAANTLPKYLLRMLVLLVSDNNE